VAYQEELNSMESVRWLVSYQMLLELYWGGGGGKGRPARRADDLTAICEPIV
jgi:hypothetical protein